MRSGAGPRPSPRSNQQQLAALLTHAHAHSPYYRQLYGALPQGVLDLRALPPVRKPELMARFDEWVTDPAVRLRGLSVLVADKERIGEEYLGRYLVATTSGSSGEPAILLQLVAGRILLAHTEGIREPLVSVVQALVLAQGRRI